MNDLASNLPRVKTEDLAVYDFDREIPCGFLYKKAGQNSTFSKGKWQKRWFVLDCHPVDITDNYSLVYFHSPDDKKPSHTFGLSGATISLLGDNNFQINFSDGTLVQLGADSIENRDKWISSIEKVVSVANLRARFITKKQPNEESPKKAVRIIADPTNHENRNGSIIEEESNAEMFRNGAPNKIERHFPTLRVGLDAHSIPPSTTQRRQFEETFLFDISEALHVDPSIFEIISVKPCPVVPWSTLVEFDVYPSEAMVSAGLQGDEIDYEALLEDRFFELKSEILWTLHEMVIDNQSPLYHGSISSKLDSTYSKYLLPESTFEVENMDFYSKDPQVQDILDKYKEIPLPPDYVDISSFTIYLQFEDTIYPMKIPNPSVIRSQNCCIWPFQVKEAIGLMGTLQELWLDPLAFTPIVDPDASITGPAMSTGGGGGMGGGSATGGSVAGGPAGSSISPGMGPHLHSGSILFAPSVRHDGSVVLSSCRLRPQALYRVEMEDLRGKILRELTEEELDGIKTVFDEFDANGDGFISKLEMEDFIRHRIQQRKGVIEEKFQQLIKEPGVQPAEVQRAEEMRRQHLQHLHESQNKLIQIFESADSNGDGQLSFMEFLLAEAWWLKCTLNPERVHLF